MKPKIKQAMQELNQHNISYKTNNDGIHIMIEHEGRRIDFWPTTGKWIARGFVDKASRGLPQLLNHLGKGAK